MKDEKDKKLPEVTSADTFARKSTNSLKAAKECKLKNDEKNPILWSISGETEFVYDDNHFIKQKNTTRDQSNCRCY